MPLTLNITDHWSDGKRIHVTGSIIFTGAYVTGGELIPFGNPAIKSQSPPNYVECHGVTGHNFSTVLATGFNQNIGNCRMKVITDSTGIELAAGNYPASILANPPNFYAIFPKFI